MKKLNISKKTENLIRSRQIKWFDFCYFKSSDLISSLLKESKKKIDNGYYGKNPTGYLKIDKDRVLKSISILEKIVSEDPSATIYQINSIETDQKKISNSYQKSPNREKVDNSGIRVGSGNYHPGKTIRVPSKKHKWRYKQFLKLFPKFK